MVFELDFWSSAKALINWRGKDVALEAARADAMLEKGDLEGCEVWKRILKAVDELQRAERDTGGALH